MRTAAILPVALFLGLSTASAAQAGTILQASVLDFGTTTITSDDVGYSPSELAGRAENFPNGYIGFVAGVGTLKADGEALGLNSRGKGLARVSISDIAFGYRSTALCRPECGSFAIPVTVSAGLDGVFSNIAGALDGIAGVDAQLRISRNGALLRESRLLADSRLQPVGAGLGPIAETLALGFSAESGSIYTLEMILGLTVDSLSNGFRHGGIRADFANTFALDPGAVFQFDDDDITVNAPSAGIVDNRILHLLEDEPIATVVPAPPAIWLLLTGLGVIGAWQRVPFRISRSGSGRSGSRPARTAARDGRGACAVP